MPKEIPDTAAVSVQGIIPEVALKKLPLLEPTLKKETQAKYLQLTAVRIDPPELRLIWQVFTAYGSLRVEALDAAVHSFHKIENKTEFLSELEKISALTRNEVNPLLPLSVHPTLEKQGMNGKYAKALIQLIKKHASEKNIFKFTFMQMSLAETKWDFGGMLLNGGETYSLLIPKISTTGTQIFINNSFHEFSGGFGPYPTEGQNEFNRLVSDTYNVQRLDDLKRAIITSHKLENPRLGNAETIDCVSCHLAQTARNWIETNNPELLKVADNKFTSKKYILKNTTPDPGRTDNVHAFSYFLDMPTINQRTINETAFVLERLNLSK